MHVLGGGSTIPIKEDKGCFGMAGKAVVLPDVEVSIHARNASTYHLPIIPIAA